MANHHRNFDVAFGMLWIALMASNSLLAAASDAVKSTTPVQNVTSSACTNCDKIHADQARKIRNSSASSLHLPSDDSDLNQILPEESENVVFSRKYSPDGVSLQDGFVPIPGPYGVKPARQARTQPVKPAPSRLQRLRQGTPPGGGTYTAMQHAQSRRHGRRGNDMSPLPDVQRRVQYKAPRAIEDLTVRESVANEDILGNGHFEIIRGGIFSDEERNEIIGSRRMARGFGSFGMPSFLEQNRFSQIQSVQFPPVYRRRGQNHYSPFFYPRGTPF